MTDLGHATCPRCNRPGRNFYRGVNALICGECLIAEREFFALLREAPKPSSLTDRLWSWLWWAGPTGLAVGIAMGAAWQQMWWPAVAFVAAAAFIAGLGRYFEATR